MRAIGELPDDPLVHAAVLAYASDYSLLESVLRRHGKGWRTPGLRAASLDHAMWFHRPARADEWLLYAQHSPSAQGGRGLGIGRMFTADGTLVATVAQEGMLRIPRLSPRPRPRPGRASAEAEHRDGGGRHPHPAVARLGADVVPGEEELGRARHRRPEPPAATSARLTTTA